MSMMCPITVISFCIKVTKTLVMEIELQSEFRNAIEPYKHPPLK